MKNKKIVMAITVMAITIFGKIVHRQWKGLIFIVLPSAFPLTGPTGVLPAGVGVPDVNNRQGFTPPA